MYWTQPLNNFLTPAISATSCVFLVKASELFPCANTLKFVCYFILGRWRQFCGSTGLLPGLLSQVIHGGNDQEVQLRRISERPGTGDTIFISLQEGLASGPFLIDCLAGCTDFISYQTALFSWLHWGCPLLTGKAMTVSLLLISGILCVPVVQQ